MPQAGLAVLAASRALRLTSQLLSGITLLPSLVMPRRGRPNGLATSHGSDAIGYRNLSEPIGASWQRFVS